MTALLGYFVHSDCSIKVSRSLVTISYEHNYVVLILCVTVLLEYLDLFIQNVLSCHSLVPIFPLLHLIFQNFALLLLMYFSKASLTKLAHP